MFIDQPNYGYYLLNEHPGEKSVIEPTQISDRMQSVDNVKSELHKNITVRKGKKKCYAERVRSSSSRNNEKKFFSAKDVSKNSIYKMKINNRVGNVGL